MTGDRLCRNHIRRQLGLVDINAGQESAPATTASPCRQFGRTASTVFLQPVGRGNYNALQARLQRRFADGFSLAINYTWGKGMSDNENSSGTPAVQAVPYMTGTSADGTDRTHNVGITSVWQTPVRAGTRAWLTEWRGGRILGGWQINNMVSMMSGVPFSVPRTTRR